MKVTILNMIQIVVYIVIEEGEIEMIGIGEEIEMVRGEIEKILIKTKKKKDNWNKIGLI